METMTTILDAPASISMARHYVVNVGEVRRVNLTLAGCGGTGSFLALHLARLAWSVRGRIDFAMAFVDPDVVEEKNVGRQNFVPAEIGRPKAEALATRYGRAFGLATRFFVDKFSGVDHLPSGDGMRHDGRLDLVVGCVDNTAARRAIAKGCDLHAAGRLWWIDCGNHDSSGQVILGNRAIDAPQISPLGFCTALPLPSVVHPELVGPEMLLPAGTNCADAILAGTQSLMVNQMVAGWAASYVHRLVMGNLDTFATYFDLHSGSARSEYIVRQGGIDRIAESMIK